MPLCLRCAARESQTCANGRLQHESSELVIANRRAALANAALIAANEREKQRFGLAMDAIKLFHGEVSEDLLLKQKQFGICVPSS